MHRRGRVAVLGAILGVVALYLIYLAAANLYLRSGRLQRALSRRPQVSHLDYAAAWTVLPGRVHVRGFRLGGETRNNQWSLAIERATLDIVVPRLLLRQFVVDGVSGDGVSFRVARRADAVVPWSTNPRLRPPIDGFANPPRPAPEVLYPATPPAPPRESWRLRISGIDLSGLHEIWIETIRWTGDGRVTGDLDLLIRHRLTIGASRVELAGGDLSQGGTAILRGLHGAIEGSSEPFDPATDAGRPAFHHLFVRARLGGQVASLGFLAPLLKPAGGLDVDAAGPLDLALRLAHGRFEPGTRAVVRADRVAVGVLDYRATGAGRVDYRVVAAGPRGPRGELTAVVDRFALARTTHPGTYARGRDLRLAAWSAPPGIDHPFMPIALDVAVPSAEVPDFSYYNAYLPKTAGIALRGGRGSLSASLHAEGPRWTGHADLRLQGEGIAADLLGTRLRGRLALHSPVARLDLLQPRFDLAGTELDVTDVALAADSAVHVPPGWWARARLAKGLLTPGKPVFLVAAVQAKIRDAGPLFAILAPRHRLLAWIDERLKAPADGVRAEAAGRLGPRLVEIDRLAVAGGSLGVEGRLRFAGGGRRGALLASYGRLAVGIELAGEERRVKLLGARQWFAAQGDAAGRGATGRGDER